MTIPETSIAAISGVTRRLKSSNNILLLLIEIDDCYQTHAKQWFAESAISIAIARLAQENCQQWLQQQISFPIKLERAQERLVEINELIQQHKSNLQLLHGFAQGHETFIGKGCTDSAAQYQRTQADNERYLWTVANLRWQIAILEREREVLYEYVL